MTQTSPKPAYYISTDASPPQKHNSSFFQWFYNLSISRKTQLIPWSTFVVLGGIVGVGAVLLVSEGRSQLLNQAKAELSLTDVNYNIKINQMGFGFRGQSDNPAIIAAAQASIQGQTLTPTLRNQVRQTLQHEVKARNIEYATLVGKDLRIIVNANRERTGEIFNPDNLVKEVLDNPQQVKTSTIVSRSELTKESPPLPSGITNQDALIRYTVTPVVDPATKTVTGALVSGDIVNGKLPIVEGTVNALGGGYSAIYLRKSPKEFTLATALDKINGQLKPNVELPNPSLLRAAEQKRGVVVTERVKLEDQTYTTAAQAILNFKGEPVAVIVRGTPETSLNALLTRSLLLQLSLSILGLGAITLLAMILRQAIARPVQQLQQTAQDFSQGERGVRAGVFARDEVGQLAVTFNHMADSIEANLEARRQETERTKLFADIAGSRVRDSQELESVFNKAVIGARAILQADRVVVYRFNPNWSGYVTAESVGDGWPQALRNKLEDPCIGDQLIEAYKNGRVVPTENVFEAGFHPEHLQLMERLQIKANLVTPIVSNNQLFGLLVAHHCEHTHAWQQSEIDFLTQLSSQLGLILDRVSLLEQQQAEAQRAQLVKDITVELAQLSQIEGIFDTAVQEIRLALNSDRVVVYSFNDKWQGTVIAESVAADWPRALGAEIDDPCFADKYVERYRQGRVQATDNLDTAGLTECHLKQLKQFAVKANLVAPILHNGQLLGLLIAHQCSGPRAWQQGEIDLFAQLATQVGFALDRVTLLQQQKTAKELLQRRALELLIEVDPVSKGDLTIRASVTEDEIGTVADSYNATIANLRKIVTQVQSAATQVATTTTSNEVSVSELSQDALRQAQEIAVALERIQEMSNSISAVAVNAAQAEAAVQQATETVEAGDAAMNRTVEGILAIRETVAVTSKKVKRLGESSQKISKVVNLIGTFANQTNLLALNAAIEAANAGEQGRGFAVVADQVRTLARQSTQATTEIEGLVMEIQTETNEVVAAMEAGTVQVVEGTKLVDETRQSLNKITAVSTQISALVEAISAAAATQSQTSEAVTQTISDVAAIASQNSNEATQVSASFKELLAVAQELQASVGQFKVS